MTIKQWIETYARELSGSEPEKELEAIVAGIAQEYHKKGYIQNGLDT
jgi:hypothetical protein